MIFFSLHTEDGRILEVSPELYQLSNIDIDNWSFISNKDVIKGKIFIKKWKLKRKSGCKTNVKSFCYSFNDKIYCITIKNNIFSYIKYFFFLKGCISLHDAAGTFLDATNKLDSVGWDIDSLRGKDPYKYYHINDRSRVYFMSHIKTPYNIQYIEWRMMSSHNTYVWLYSYSFMFSNHYILSYTKPISLFHRIYLSLFKRDII